MIEKTYSKGDYKRLSERIRQNPKDVSQSDLEMLQALRVTYKEPLSTVFNAIERIAQRIDRNSICTYRVKRIESIINKLVRFPEMQVQRMEDIAGCRVILTTEDDVDHMFKKVMKDLQKLPFEIKGKINNYIENPKPSGYRSIHFNVCLDGSNQRIEVQLRCLDQHFWATLVEISDLIYHSRLKEYGEKGNAELFEFHRLLAQPDPILTRQERRRISDISAKYLYIEKISSIFTQNYLEVRKRWNNLRLQRKLFFLIATGSDGMPEFTGYSHFEEAERAYFELYNNNDEQRNIVLTHLQTPSFHTISIAYSNYILTYNSALVRILSLLIENITHYYRTYNVPRFVKYYKNFQDIVYHWVGNKYFEMLQFNHDENVKKSAGKRKEWKASIDNDIERINAIIGEMNRSISHIPMHLVPFTVKKTLDAKLKRRLRELRQQQQS